MKTFSDILESILRIISAKNSKIDTSEGTITNDVVAYAPSQEIAQLYEQINSVSEAQSLLTSTGPGTETHTSNIGIIRKSPRYSTGNITLFTVSAPTYDVTVPKDTVVGTYSTTSRSGVQFKTQASVTMYSSLASSYLNPTTNVYEISVPIQAISPGTEGNIGAQNITSVISPIGGIDGCYNSAPTVGGTDLEDEELLKSRYRTHWVGNTLATQDGILDAILAYDEVDDARVVGHGETGRDEMCALDVYIKGSIITQQKDVFNYPLDPIPDLLFTKQPVIPDSIIDVQSSISGSISSSLWSFIEDGGVYAGSIRGYDKVVWDVPMYSTSYGSIYVIYTYNSLIEQIQSDFTKSDKDVLDVNILIKQAKEFLIDLTCNIKVLAGYDSSTVILDIQNNLAAFFNTFKMGIPVQQADVARVILNTSGVDDVQLPFTYFRDRELEILPDSFGDLNIPDRGYAAPGTITINVIV